ncbi:hypothetical protein LCGC14_2755380, partial [marine sediment metagenome]
VRVCADEQEVYALLGLDYVEPELRESRGELEAAMALAFILLAVVYAVMLTLTIAQQRRRPS